MSISTLKAAFAPANIFKSLPEHFKKESTICLKGAIGSFHAFLVDGLAISFKSILIITDTDEHQRFLKSDLNIVSDSEIIHFPATNQKPYDDEQIIDSGLLVQRSEALQRIQSSPKKIVVTSAEAVFEKVAPPAVLDNVSLILNKGEETDLDVLKEQLVDQGYLSVKFVDEPGEFALRGGILDVFPFSGEYPIRLEFFGDELDSIREFDASSQRSVSFLNQARIIPDLSNLPDSRKDSLLSYFESDTLLILEHVPLINALLNDRFKSTVQAFKAFNNKEKKYPDELFFSNEQFVEELNNFKSKLYTGVLQESSLRLPVQEIKLKPQPDFHGNFKLLNEHIRSLSEQGIKTYIFCDNDGQKTRFEDLLGNPNPHFNYQLGVESLHEGFIFEEAGIALYTDHQIFNRYHRPKIKKRRYSGGLSFKELKYLSIGDYVVHVDYGIGKFAGFKKIQIKETEQEVVVLKYQQDSVLYVNVSSLHKLQKYSGKEGTAPGVTKLGSGEWSRKKALTKKKVKDIARELIQLYAKRKLQKAYAFSPDQSWQAELEARFEYEETPDQNEAVNAVKKDMESPQPMDRLVCGDVGFGKTEVAVRAAFKAVLDHKQVGVLVPTTILAEQHAKTFKKRMGNFPVKIEILSRFKTPAEQKNVIAQLEKGGADIVIGTHRLLSKDVKFKDLGLVIVDEEQRFGVGAKEKLKKFRAAVDVLTLTATPIPRTLQFSLMGARDLSVINTPPPNRQPVYTEIHGFNEVLIHDAVLQEMSRGGQVFFIHNRVKNIEETAEMIQRLVPDIRVRYGHGQMTGSHLEKIIGDFYTHKFDVLVSTNIVENGIDISNANTIIINNANNFGLAELHQLRGRVGRSNRKAFCYLITPPIETLTPEAGKRLLALEEFSDLGSGFNIAMRDLDIRGAGDILGGEQSGFINDIGFELYTKILNDAVRELKESEFSTIFDRQETDPELPETKVEFDVSALLPQSYVADNVERLNLYRKLSESKKEQEIDEWREEIEDRFGPTPKEADQLITASKIKLYASQNYFTKVTIRAERMWCICPKTGSELGNQYFESGKFQKTLNRLEKLKPDQFQVVQKDKVLRFVIRNIPNYDEAYSFLKKLAS